MLLNILDGNGAAQVICALSQGAATDYSGTISVTDTAQQIVGANASRSGLFFQNRGVNNMVINELGSAELADAFLIPPGGTWPPPNYPIPTGAISVGGAAGDTYVYREW